METLADHAERQRMQPPFISLVTDLAQDPLNRSNRGRIASRTRTSDAEVGSSISRRISV